jgi:hypothetical protein
MTATGKCYPYTRVITEIRINSQPCKGIKLTTRHTRARRSPWVARCLPCSREEEKLASSKFAAFSKSAGLAPMRYGARGYFDVD